jgi:hypothetical protein
VAELPNKDGVCGRLLQRRLVEDKRGDGKGEQGSVKAADV